MKKKLHSECVSNKEYPGKKQLRHRKNYTRFTNGHEKKISGKRDLESSYYSRERRNQDLKVATKRGKEARVSLKVVITQGKEEIKI